MKIKFNNIIIQNFLSIGYAELDFNDNGYILVKGINNNSDDLALSNGSGKSSLFEAICWCLTGETIRGIKSGVSNLYADDGAYVELNLEISDDIWRIIRTKDHKQYKTNLKLLVNGSDKSGKGIRDTENILKEYLPDLTSSLIGSVVILGQGLPQRFSNNTPSGRKDVLEKLSKSDFMIENLKERISNRKIFLGKELRKVEDLDIEYNTKLKSLKDDLKKKEDSLNSLESEEKLKKSLKEKQEILNKNLDLLEIYNLDIEKLDKYLQDLRDEYSSYSKKKSDISLKIENKKLKETSKIDKQHNEELNKLNLDLSSIKSKIDYLKNEIKRINSIKDVCPTCGQRIVGVEKPSTKHLDDELLTNENVLYNINNNIDSINIIYNNNISNIRNKYKNILEKEITETNKKLQKIVEDGKSLKEDFENLKNKKSVLEKENNTFVEKIKDLDIKIKNLNFIKKSLEDDIISIKDSILNFDKKIMYNIKDKELLESRLDIINKFNIAVSRDFRGYLLNNVINYINSKAKEYSKYIFDTDKIDFILNGNNINISYCNKQYENLSGGERQKVDLIVQFSIRDMLCKFLDFSCNILIVDEIFDNLDSIGCQKVINLISTKLQDISNIFIVTHRSDLEIPYDKEIIVEKDSKGISSIK